MSLLTCDVGANVPAVAVRALENDVIDEEEFASLGSEKTSGDAVRIVYAGLLVLLRSALRLPQSSLKSEVRS